MNGVATPTIWPMSCVTVSSASISTGLPCSASRSIDVFKIPDRPRDGDHVLRGNGWRDPDRLADPPRLFHHADAQHVNQRVLDDAVQGRSRVRARWRALIAGKWTASIIAYFRLVRSINARCSPRVAARRETKLCLGAGVGCPSQAHVVVDRFRTGDRERVRHTHSGRLGRVDPAGEGRQPLQHRR
jgi:hypothetical protein